MSTPFEQAIERKVGESVDSIRRTPIDERRRKIEWKFGKPMKILAVNNPLRTHQEIEADLDRALR